MMPRMIVFIHGMVCLKFDEPICHWIQVVDSFAWKLSDGCLRRFAGIRNLT